ncbi:hypothetical protein SPOG_03530 [Schizosaccharomyces cryophilus OY26]|uniref:Uncharacterized protein n=1 Tax=Schizosaccharomyces cryophilus (strain OY26 / ATCC MYA-4695 / CBS 11777 / NBRC 106824 / NRRL Y48691) TaxID=653667 RepID=S9X8A9_SCHCR|nr:uncharacterized protein SPOG_03530 [Schizosaccharomyces cryophilus OY26]EPY50061.1 hypothetical protein SPOG_03530 [Schizosaccharomyces cryophilus OY26]
MDNLKNLAGQAYGQYQKYNKNSSQGNGNSGNDSYGNDNSYDSSNNNSYGVMTILMEMTTLLEATAIPHMEVLMVTQTTCNNNMLNNSKSQKSFDQTSNSSKMNSDNHSAPLDTSSFINAFSKLGLGKDNDQKSSGQGSDTISYAAVFSAVQKYFSKNGDALATGQVHSEQHQQDFLSMVEQEAQGLIMKGNSSSGQGQRGAGGFDGDAKSAVQLAKTLFQNRNMLMKLVESGGSSQASGNSAVLASVVGSFLGGSTSTNSNSGNNNAPQANAHGLQDMAQSFLGPGNHGSSQNVGNSQASSGLGGLQNLAGSLLGSGKNSTSDSGNQQQSHGNSQSGLASNLLNAVTGENGHNGRPQEQSKHSEDGGGLMGKAINMFLQ